MMVTCRNQADIDELWVKLSDGGEEGPCGWLKDKFALSWRIVSPDWNDMLREKDPARAERVTEAILTMSKPDLAAIRQAFERET